MSKLEDMSVEFRDDQIKKNNYTQNDEYRPSHPDTLSDGDELGKDEFNGSVGSLSDIKARESMMKFNKYNRNNEYNDLNA